MSLVAPLANLVAIPAFALWVVPVALSSVVVWSLGAVGAATWLIDLAAWPLAALWAWLEWLSSFEGSRLSIGFRPPWTLVCAAIGILLALMPRGLPGRWLAPLWIAPALLWRAPTPAAGEILATVLDVGQGLAVVVRTSDHWLVYDTGARFSDTFNAGEAALVPTLRHYGAGTVDRLVISHADNDHRGGARGLAAHYGIDDALSSVPILHLRSRPCHQRQRWRWDEVDFVMLAPPAGQRYSGNDSSCVLRIEGPFGSLLLPGDIEADRERALVDEYADGLRSTVLVVPHHGSRTSSTRALLAAVSPELAIVSRGLGNPYGHPHPTIVDRYRQRDIDWLDTAFSGAVTVDIGPRGVAVRRQRQEEDGYWRP
jgi:competence protein ComEC